MASNYVEGPYIASLSIKGPSSFHVYPDLTVSITCSGSSPIMVGLKAAPDEVAANPNNETAILEEPSTGGRIEITLFRNDTQVLPLHRVLGKGVWSPPCSLWFIDSPPAGTAVYTIRAKVGAGTILKLLRLNMFAYEM